MAEQGGAPPVEAPSDERGETEDAASTPSPVAVLPGREEASSTASPAVQSQKSEGGASASSSGEQAEDISTPPAAEEARVSPEAKELPEGPLNFAEHMFDRFDFLWHKRVEPSERLLEQVTAALQARADLEKRYANAISQVAGQVRIGDNSEQAYGSVGDAVEAVLVNFRNRGEQSVNLAAQIEQDIISTFEDVLTQHKQVYKRMRADMDLLIKYVHDSRKEFRKSAHSYANKCYEAEIIAKQFLEAITMRPVDRTTIGKKAITLTLQARTAEGEYYETIGQLNKALELHAQHLPVVLAAMQDMEEKRSLCLRDGLRKLAVFEMSWLRNMQYDLEATVQCAEDADPAVDLQKFITEVWKEQGNRQIERPAVAPSTFFDLKGRLALKDTPEWEKWLKDEPMVRQFNADYDAHFRFVLTEQAAGSIGETEQEKSYVALRAGLADPRQRAALSTVLLTYVLSFMPPGTEIDNAHPASVNLLAFERVVGIFERALDACDQGEDSYTGRMFMRLADKFTVIGETGKQTSLLTRIYSHKIWSKVSFWEDALVIGICEGHAAEATTRRLHPAGSAFTAPPLTHFTIQFAKYMQKFGIRTEQVRSSISSTLRKHAALLGANVKYWEKQLLVSTDAAHTSQLVAETSSDVTEGSAASNNGDVNSSAGGQPSGAKAVADTGAVATTAEDDEDDDFEAVALGLRGDEKAGGVDEDDTSAEALKLVASQRPVNEVFGD